MKMNLKSEVFLTFSIIFLLKNSPSAAVNQDDYFKEDMNTYRLKGLIEPLHYNINLTVFLLDGPKQFTYDGHISILLKTFKSNVNEIILYKRDLIINETAIDIKKYPDLEEQESFSILGVKSNTSTEKFGIILNRPLEPRVIYNLTLQFNNVLSENMIGFYRSSYQNINKDDIWLATTQFNDKHARQAFPCFDEPKFKATFNITLNYENELTAISNTKPISYNLYGKRSETTFETTPKMATYLVAFLISDYDELTTEHGNFTVLAPKHLVSYSNYALDVGPKFLEILNEYFQINYNELGIDKMHIAAIPDFAAGAMENWGLLLFKEKYIYCNMETTQMLDKQRIATVIAHEQSHMWFGNLITLEWWNHLWVNEGFARYFEYFIPHKVFPEWELDKLFVFQQIHSSMLVDSLEGTSPMTIHEANTKPYNPPAEYTTISYNKGASILRMFQYCMGEDNFRQALQNLLVERKFYYATPEDVLISLRNEWIHKNIDFMEFFVDWTEQPGYPVVHVSLSNNDKSIKITQKRFILDVNKNHQALNPNLTYTIPITFTTNIDKKFTIPNEKEIIFMKSTESVKEIEISKEPINWFIFNIQHIGFYRVNYDTKNWLNLKEALNKSMNAIHEINRANIIDDLFNFARSGLLKYHFIFDILKYLKVETEYIPLSAALNGFHFIKMRMGDEYAKDFNQILSYVLNNAYNKYGLEEKPSDGLLNIYSRNKILKWICKAGHNNCIKKSLELFINEKKHNIPLSKNIRDVIYCTALNNPYDIDPNSTFQYVQKVYENIDNPTEKQSLLGILGCVNSENNIRKHYKFILTPDVKLQDKMLALNSLIAENSNNIVFLFALIGSDLEKLGESLGGGENSVLAVISNIAQYFTDDNHITIMKEFIKSEESSYFSEAGRSALNKTLEKITENVEWKKSHKDDIDKVLHGAAIKFSYSSILVFSLGLFLYITQ